MPSPSNRKARITRVGSRYYLFYRCNSCEVVWSPSIKPGGRMYRGWWRCPHGCNHDVRTT